MDNERHYTLITSWPVHSPLVSCKNLMCMALCNSSSELVSVQPTIIVFTLYISDVHFVYMIENQLKY